ncbi:Phasin family protein [Rhodovastum atsumiense]|uniref:Phasin family protein n=1 Tax=Rhodovastum atsumiense TaxID=504468 RepID=A0A5M6IQQ9_9PROT|nr:phasin family protein [Rhodovastum atsumiense]KAA5610620.1 phasin family protein [Rhodovastum atsumiense]CAH2600740.1 Phasin family protein [Rhodovastum atsumiense]
MEKAFRISEELANFGKGNVEAFVASGQVWSAGVQALAQDLASTTQAHLDEGVATVKAFAAAKSVKQLFDLQTAYARSTMEKALAETTRFTTASTKLATDALAPLGDRVKAAGQAFNTAA